MSSSEPPSRIPPRGHIPDSKASRDELSSKGKVEKVREIDADESRKKKFQKFYKDNVGDDLEIDSDRKPSPFDLYSEKKGAPLNSTPPLVSSHSDLDDIADAVVPSPAYSPPPDLTANSMNIDEEEDVGLPRSNDFWEEVDFPPDKPTPPKSFQETSSSKEKITENEQRKEKKEAKKKEEKQIGAYQHELKEKDKYKGSLFGPPGKTESVKPEKKEASSLPPHVEKKPLPSPFDPKHSLHKQSEKTGKALPSTEKDHTAPFHQKETHLGKAKETKREKEEAFQGPGPLPHHQEEKESGSGKRGRDGQIIEVHPVAGFPSHIEPMAAAAAQQASPYLTPTTVSLFFQMVGTMYVMTGTQGVNRTEIVLNNPSFADSKFFGSTIKIEKYATAPDSFNITLSGSDEAVATFKENIPSLMAAFQNGKFSFKVSRLDAEYVSGRPVYRRKEKGEDKGDAGGGDLGERRK